MRVALIAPWVVAPPIIGGLQIRFYQLQVLLARAVAPEPLLVWDLRERGPVDLAALPSSDPTQPELSAFLPPRGLQAHLLWLRHLWPSWVERSLASQRQPLLAWLAAQGATHVVLVHPYASELAPELKRRGLHVFIDCHNVESALARQLAALAATPAEAHAAQLRARVFRRREQRCFPWADEIWLPSELDLERQRRICGDRIRLRCLPNALDLSHYENERVPPEAPQVAEVATQDLVYPAEFGYQPNVAAAELLCERVLPAVRRACPAARLVLVGRDRYGLVARLRREPEVVVTGTVADVRPYLRRAAAVPVPLLQASGTRYKILEALALERAVVTTPLGAEGLAVRDGEHLLIRDVADFSAALIALLRDPQRARALGRQGRRLVEERYTWEALLPLLRAALEEAGTPREKTGAC
jgi:glycosyltransferase involved in cell wall biosynthesis